MRIEWAPMARASARRFMTDQSAMRAIGAAIAALADDPFPLTASMRPIITGYGLAVIALPT